ncbi:MAG: pentapeptide repeat-containing protein [bacterium]
MKYEIVKDPDKPFPKNERNTVATYGTATVTETDKDGNQKTTKYGIVRNVDIYKLINEGKQINIEGCFVEKFSIAEYWVEYNIKKESEVKIKNISALNSFFNDFAHFRSATFNGDAVFSSATFNGVAYFDSATFDDNTTFDSTIFSGDAYFYSATFSGDAYFDSATFSDSANFSSATFSGSANFSSVTFNSDATFSFSIFSGYVFFYFASFSGSANFSSVTFSGDANFSPSTFSGDANFSFAKFSGDTYFDSATFCGYASFFSAKFSGRAFFDSVTFRGDAIFYSATFSGSAAFYSVKFKGEMNWDGTKFRKEVHLKNAFFEYPVNFSNLKFLELDLTGVVFDKYALFKNCEIDKGPRETFRIIKNEFMRTNNRIDALDYHKKEMEEYEAELKKERNKETIKRWKIKQWNRNHWYLNCRYKKYWGKDEIILKLNKITNYYGVSWPQALKVTLSFSLITFSLLFLCGISSEMTYYEWGWKGWISFSEVCEYYLKGFLSFLDITHKFNFLGEGSLNFMGYIIDFIARLGIGYGYFQIIQAFRKFKIW